MKKVQEIGRVEITKDLFLEASILTGNMSILNFLKLTEAPTELVQFIRNDCRIISDRIRYFLEINKALCIDYKTMEIVLFDIKPEDLPFPHSVVRNSYEKLEIIFEEKIDKKTELIEELEGKYIKCISNDWIIYSTSSKELTNIEGQYYKIVNILRNIDEEIVEICFIDERGERNTFSKKYADLYFDFDDIVEEKPLTVLCIKDGYMFDSEGKPTREMFAKKNKYYEIKSYSKNKEKITSVDIIDERQKLHYFSGEFMYKYFQVDTLNN